MVINRYGLDGREAFLGFTFNDKHSSQFRIVRVTNGKRQEENLLPNSKDTTQDIPGRDGLLYLGSKYQQKEFSISFAFDDLREEDISAIRDWLSPKVECKLIFDETPYKYYWGKLKGAPKLSYICFDDNDDDANPSRVYRGDGQVQFVCYESWATSVGQTVELVQEYHNRIEAGCAGSTVQGLPGSIDPDETTYGKLTNQWVKASKMPDILDPFMNVVRGEGNFIYYNFQKGGDLPMLPFICFAVSNEFVGKAETLAIYYADIKSGGASPETLSPKGAIYLKIQEPGLKKYLTWANNNGGKEAGYYVLYDSRSKLILGIKNPKYDNNNFTYDIVKDENGNAVILNGAIIAGDFMEIPPPQQKGEWASLVLKVIDNISDPEAWIYAWTTPSGSSKINCIPMEYRYY